jgi:hypothetical protein
MKYNTVEWVTNWFATANERIDFISYKAGCGGEFIVNYIQKHYHIPSVSNESYSTSYDASTNRHSSNHCLLSDFFCYLSIINDDGISDNPPTIDTYEDLARQFIKFSEHNYINFEDMEIYLKTTERLIIRYHKVLYFMPYLFPKSKKILVLPGTDNYWLHYINIVCYAKLFHKRLYSREEKLWFLKNEVLNRHAEDPESWEYRPTWTPSMKKERPIPRPYKEILKQVEVLLEDGIPVFESVFRQLVMPEDYKTTIEEIENIDVTTLNDIRYQYSHIFNYTDEVINSDGKYYRYQLSREKEIDLEEYYQKEFTMYNMDDVLSGKILEGFELSQYQEDFSIKAHEWDRKNIEYLNELGIPLITREQWTKN